MTGMPMMMKNHSSLLKLRGLEEVVVEEEEGELEGAGEEEGDEEHKLSGLASKRITSWFL